MQNKKLLIFIIIAFAFLLLAPVLSSAQTKETPFVPLEPKLQIPIPDLTFSKIVRQGQLIGIPYLADYIAGVYKYAVGIVSFVAIIMIMVGGLRWMTAGGNASAIGGAKEMISGAVIGLFIALGSYIVLYTINPDLVSFKNLQVKLIARQELETDVEDASKDALILKSATACNTIDTCKTLCAKPQSEWPTATAGMASPSAVQSIPITGGVNPRGFKARPEVISALQAVGQAASQKGEAIQINDGYRTLDSQIKKVCDKINAGKTADIGKTVAWPGGSRHGIGVAVDVYLIKNKIALTSKDMTQANIDELEELMRKGGFVRYCPEWWHFEIGTAGSPQRPANLSSYCPRPYSK
ncbi:MAG: D-alanyl-D-alanine carboxypeptidase family protein [bacterium]